MRRKARPLLPSAPMLLLMAAAPQGASTQIADREALIAALDSAARAHADHELVAGVSVGVVRGSDTLLLAGYGRADLEWDVATPRDARVSYEIGSVTKQFTAAAILKLAEEGKLDLEADFTDYVEFDTRGRHIPLRRLLDHTSGIKGYTEMPVFGELMVRDLPRDTLVRLIEAEPFEFEPGTALIYNNSAYFLLGLVIERVSGQPYEAFVAERLFEPLGMRDSYYCSERAVRYRRAHGYDAAPDGLQRKAYLDHTWPYSAGSLCSTAGDLIRWNQALHGGEVLSAASYADMIEPDPLIDGTEIRYAMGLGVSDDRGRRLISHGGGINGFLSDGRYYPDEDLIVIVLQNSAGPRGPAALGGALAELVLGAAEEAVAEPYAGDLGPLGGVYAGPSRGREMRLTVSAERGRLTLTVNDGEPFEPEHQEGLTWRRGGARITFVERDGRIDEVRYDTGGGHYVLKRTG